VPCSPPSEDSKSKTAREQARHFANCMQHVHIGPLPRGRSWPPDAMLWLSLVLANQQTQAKPVRSPLVAKARRGSAGKMLSRPTGGWGELGCWCGDRNVGEGLERPGDHDGSRSNVPLWLASDFHAPASRGLEPGDCWQTQGPEHCGFWSLSCLNGTGVAASVPPLRDFIRSSCDISLSERRATVPGASGWMTICCRAAPSRPGYSWTCTEYIRVPCPKNPSYLQKWRLSRGMVEMGEASLQLA